MTRIFKTQAIVLKKQDLLNKDVLLTLFTEKYGLVRIVGFGVKKITSRRLSHLQTGNFINATIYVKKSFFSLKETELVSGFLTIKNNQSKLIKIYLYFFILDRLLPENQREEKVFELTKKFLFELAKKNDFDNFTLNNYLNEVLINLGYIREKKSFNEIKNLIEEIINEKIPRFW